MESHLVSAHGYISCLDIVELEFHNEKERELHMEILNEPIDE
jgi:hypothetical protein